MHVNSCFSAVACGFREIQAVVSKVLSPVHLGKALFGAAIKYLWLHWNLCLLSLACPRTHRMALGRVLCLSPCSLTKKRAVSPLQCSRSLAALLQKLYGLEFATSPCDFDLTCSPATARLTIYIFFGAVELLVGWIVRLLHQVWEPGGSPDSTSGRVSSWWM